jgi:fatty-acyl-CoA synthase
MTAWIAVSSRAHLEEARRSHPGDVYVVPARTPIYGRPGDRLCLELQDADLIGSPARVVAALPVRAGVLVAASPAGLAVLREAARRGRGPRAARVRDAGEARSAVEAGAEFLVGVDGLQPVAGATLVQVEAGGAVASPTLEPTLHAGPSGTFGAELTRAARQVPAYAQLKRDADAVARALLAAGVGRGDRVVLVAGNAPEWPAIQLGCGAIGAVLVPVNPRLSTEEREYILKQSGAKLELPLARSWAEFLRQGDAVGADRVTRAGGSVRPDDIASILYTSGTTGVPKGAMLTHRGMLQNAAAVGAALRLTSADRICLPVPLHHCFGCVMGTLAALVYRATVVLTGERFDADRVLATISSERCTVLYGVPTMFVAELEHQARLRADLSSLRTGVIAGAPVDAELARRVQRELHIPALTVAYGLTEASPVVTMTTIDDPEEVRLGTVGRSIAGAAVKVVDPETGRPVAAGKSGELCTRGPMVMRGYWNMPHETRAAIDSGGWLHTGDLASRDAHGYWRIEGRSKDMIIRGGENIYPAALEAVARRHPSIADAAVVGIPSDYFGEEVFAWIRPAPGSAMTAEEVRSHFVQHVAPFEVPKAIGFLDQFPTTESGKVLKTRLREMAVAPAAPVPQPSRAQHAPAAAIAVPWLEAKSEPSTAPPAGSPRPGWNRPETPTWSGGTTQKERPVPTTTENGSGRKRGKRIKPWGIGTNVREQIEGTGEKPIMYQALGTPVRSEHPFNLYNDIRSQPDALAGTFETAHEAAEVARRLTDRRPETVIGLGSGTSQYVAQVANAAFARFAGLPGWDFDSLAFLRYPPAVDFRKAAVMAYSGSGSTVDTVAAAKRSREAGAYTVAFTSVDGSPVVQNTDSRILTAGGFDTGGSDTFHYTARVAAAIYLSLELGKLRKPGEHDYGALQAKLLETPRLMAERLEAIDARCRTIAERYHKVRGILVVGAGSNYGTAEEIALKFDEMSHIPTKPMLPGRHIHGALGLTDEEILTVLIAPPGPAYEDMVTIAKVTNMLKTPAVAIVSDSDTQIGDLVDYVVRLPLDDETLFAVLAVLPGQLLPYWCGVLLGLNPDTQRSNIPKYARVWNMLFPADTH